MAQHASDPDRLVVRFAISAAPLNVSITLQCEGGGICTLHIAEALGLPIDALVLELPQTLILDNGVISAITTAHEWAEMVVRRIGGGDEFRVIKARQPRGTGLSTMKGRTKTYKRFLYALQQFDIAGAGADLLCGKASIVRTWGKGAHE